MSFVEIMRVLCECRPDDKPGVVRPSWDALRKIASLLALSGGKPLRYPLREPGEPFGIQVELEGW